MFCKNCGKENADGVGYCAACGSDLNKAVPTTETVTSGSMVKAQKKRIPKIPLVIACAVLVVLFAFYQIAASATKPETVIKEHVTALVNGDYDALYDGLDIPEGVFTTKEQFVASYAISSEMPENKIISIAITEAAADDLKGITPLPGHVVDAVYKVVYSTQLEPAPSTEIIMLTQKGKAFLFFDKYKVEPSNFIAQEYSIVAPVGIQVGFDGIELDDTFLSEVETSKNERDGENPTERNIYTIPNTFFGEHLITAKSDFTEDYEAPVYVKSGQTETISGLEIKAGIHAQMREMAEETLRLFFDSMVASKTFADISAQMNLVPGQEDAIGNAYDSFMKTNWGRFPSGATYTNISITNVRGEDKNDSALTNRPLSPLSYRLGYTVSCDAEAQKGYFLIGNTHSEQSFEMKIGFAYEDGALKIYSVGY